MKLTPLELLAAEAMRENGFNPCYHGHIDWVHLGGANCGCGENGACSVPVYHCTVCGDSDYGDNTEADEQRKLCYELHGNYLDEEEDDPDRRDNTDEPSPHDVGPQ